MTILTLTMIGGIISIVILIFLRFQDGPSNLDLPERIMLPNDAKPIAFTQTRKWFAIVTEGDNVLVFDTKGKLIQTIKLNKP